MAAWHVAAATFLFRWIFRDPKVDMRFLAAGALVPDLIDLTAATLLGAGSGELWAHSLVVPSAVAVAVVLATRRGRRRRGWMALVVAWLFHIFIDRMWIHAEVFGWPFFGFDLVGESGIAFWAGAWERATGDPWRWLLEAIGLIYLVVLGTRNDLGDAERRQLLFRSGRLAE